MVVEPRNVTLWDQFIEVVLLSSLLVLFLLIPFVVPDYSPALLNILMFVDLVLFFVSLIVIIIYWFFSLFKRVKGRALSFSVVSNYLLVFLMPFILLLLSREHALREVKENYLYALFTFFGLVVFHCMLISFYPVGLDILISRK